MLAKTGKEQVDRLFSFYARFASSFGIRSLPRYRAPQIACVYAFDMSDDTVKIGLTTQLDERKKGVKSAVYLDILRVHHTGYAPLDFMREIERRCHHKFAPFRVRGEYFAISFEDACAELDRYREEIADALKTADENFIDELKYFEELKEQYIKSYIVKPFAPNVIKPEPVVEESANIYRVYLLLLSDGNVTIGVTENLIAHVAKIERETGLKVVDMYFTPEMPRKDARLVEWASQKKLAPQRVRGEFFSADFDEARAIIDYFVKITTATLPPEYLNRIADKQD